jgi:hypothetical protein
VVAGNQGLCFFYPKTCFATYYLLKTPIKHPRNHDKPNHDLKKPKNRTQPETKNKLELRYVFSQTIKI